MRTTYRLHRLNIEIARTNEAQRIAVVIQNTGLHLPNDVSLAARAARFTPEERAKTAALAGIPEPISKYLPYPCEQTWAKVIEILDQEETEAMVRRAA